MKNSLLICILFSTSLYAADWSSQAKLPGEQHCFNSHGHEVCLSDGNRKNILELPDEQWQKKVARGAKHVLSYPVEITRLQLPKDSMDKFFTSDSRSPLRRFIFNMARRMTQFKSFKDVFNWIGLHEFPQQAQEVGPNLIYPVQDFESTAMGVTTFDHNTYQGITISCAGCHSSDLFGVKVIGLTNRFPKANEAFILGKKVLSKTPALAFRMMVGPSNEDFKMFKEAKSAMSYVRMKKPLTLGLDTSLAQVGLSLEIRQKDEYATMKRTRRQRYSNPLNHKPADSKPAVWWNLKYKTKWLSDASIQSGNPVHTNFLWNEIGRGQDLKKLENWFKTNQDKVDELTAYVFNTEAPRYNDFFPNSIDISRAKRGEQLYLKNCKGCHGIYTKGWSEGEVDYEQALATTKVQYHTQTIVKNVGTDPYRAQGMNYFYKDLNRLKISKSIGTVVTPQVGYVPPPLVGIWARYPYFHNNSVPTLYDVLTPDYDRPKTYIAVPAQNKATDFDQERNGYPRAEFIRDEFKNNRAYFYDSKKRGMSNLGHTTMLLDENNQPKFDHEDKLDLIEFLKSI